MVQFLWWRCFGYCSTRLLILQEVHGVVAFEGIADTSHAVVGCEIVHLRKNLPLPIDAIAHPAPKPLLSNIISMPISESFCIHITILKDRQRRT